MNNARKSSMGWMLFLLAALAGCQPRTAAEKAENAAEDAAHETGQVLERTGERAKDAVN